MKLKDIMTPEVKTIEPHANLLAAAKKMKEGDLGSLPVCDGDRLVGMITDRDIVVRGLSENRDILKTQVLDVMSSPIVYCYEDNDPGEVARIMEVKKIRRIVVLNRQKRLVGIASLDNFAVNQCLPGEVLAYLTHTLHSEAA